MDVELRPWTADDAEALNEAVAASLSHLQPWMEWVQGPPMSVAARRAWIAARGRDAAGGEQFTYGAFVDGAIAGGCGLHRRVGPGGLEIGYWVHADWVRRGVASAAVRRCCEIAFAMPSVQLVEIHHDVANVASGAVARRCGFSVVTEVPRPPAAPRDTGVDRIWRLTRATWMAARA